MVGIVIGTLGHVLVSMLMSLMTETFLKKAIIYGLEKLVNLTETDVDNRLLAAAEEAWGEKKEAGE